MFSLKIRNASLFKLLPPEWKKYPDIIRISLTTFHLISGLVLDRIPTLYIYICIYNIYNIYTYITFLKVDIIKHFKILATTNSHELLMKQSVEVKVIMCLSYLDCQLLPFLL